MRTAGTRSNSITPLRQPFETIVSESGDQYKSIDRWRSRFYSSTDDYLSPSFLDDTHSLSSSPLFYDETPDSILNAPNGSPIGQTNAKKLRFSNDSRYDSHENTPINHRNNRRFTSTGTPIYTPPSSRNSLHDDEGFLIPDLPSSRKRYTRTSQSSNAQESYNYCSPMDPVHITMPPRLGLPMQTPLKMRDQYKKSPLPIVAANLDYRTIYMGDKLAARARELRERGEAFQVMPSLYSDVRSGKTEYQEQPHSEDPSILIEDDYILHHGELLRNKYSRSLRSRTSTSGSSKIERSRSLSSYYSGTASSYGYSPGNRSNSVAMNRYNSLIGNGHFCNKKRRIGSYIAAQSDLLQQHIQLIDKSLERYSKETSNYESSANSVNNYSRKHLQESNILISNKSENLGNLTVGCISESISPEPSSVMKSTKIRSSQEVDPIEVVDNSGPQTDKNCISGLSKSLERTGSVEFEVNSPKFSQSDKVLNIENEEPLGEIVIPEYTNSPLINPQSHSPKDPSQSDKSVSSLDEIVPHPIPTSMDIINDLENTYEFEDPIIINQSSTNQSGNKLLTSKKGRTAVRHKKLSKKAFNRRRHIDYHIPIDQVKPHGTDQRELLEESNPEVSSRRYPKRLRTAPLKWYLGERLEYHRDEKNELGYTIAAIHKVANPKMLPNERGSIHPNNDNISAPIDGMRSNQKRKLINKKKPNSEPKEISIGSGNSERARVKSKLKMKNKVGDESINQSNAVTLKNHNTGEEFSMITVFDRNALCWADVEYALGKPYSVALSFISSQATCCEICLPPQTEKGLDESQDNYILGHVYMAPDSSSLQIMISDNNVYNIGMGDWFLIPDNTNYNFSNTSDHSEIYLSLYVIKDS
ncbi:RmlC-like jelly roll fold containing protein [Cryptosporidium felis]|nr:RmlC-like jelly roll fold containing protein [Cryptosporidium felis]